MEGGCGQLKWSPEPGWRYPYQAAVTTQTESASMNKIPVATLFIVAAVLFFLAAIANPANRAVYIALGVMFMILSITRKRKPDGSA
jgi:hypothetical protein